eukprot:1768089-Rhodomonas_salina.1
MELHVSTGYEIARRATTYALMAVTGSTKAGIWHRKTSGYNDICCSTTSVVAQYLPRTHQGSIMQQRRHGEVSEARLSLWRIDSWQREEREESKMQR